MKIKINHINPKSSRLHNFIGYIGHEVSVIITDMEEIEKQKESKELILDVIDIPTYKRSPLRIKYDLLPVEEDEKYFRESIPVKFYNMPKKLPGLKYVVSRESLRVITKENKKILLNKELDELEKSLSELEKSDLRENQREKIVGIKEKMEKIRQIIGEPIMEEPRYDFYAPGFRYFDKDGNIIGCLKLLKIVE